MIRVSLLSLVLVAFAAAVQAQSISSASLNAGSTGGSYYRFADTGDVTVHVKVWGSVTSPGLYEVSQGMHLSTLFTLAGGPRNADHDRRAKQSMTVRLVRGQVPVFETTMEDAVVVFETDPIVEEGDVLLVETYSKQRFSWRDTVSIVAAVGTVALVVERVTRLR